MEKEKQEGGNNLLEVNEEKEKQKTTPKTSQTPQRTLRNAKKVNYSQFFSDDADNSEDYESPEEKKRKMELSRKRTRPKSTTKSNTEAKTNKKKKTQKEANDENNNNEADKKDKDKEKMEVEEEKNKDKKAEENADKKNKNSNIGQIINIAEALTLYNNNIPNSELILIILEICLNSSQFGIDKDNSSRLFWEEIGKKPELKVITDKFKPETLRKYWRTIRETKKFKKIVSETKKYKNELNNPNMKLFSSIHAVCEYVSNPGRKMNYYINKHITKPSNKTKKITADDMTPNEQIDDIINTFIKYFPDKNEKQIAEVLFQNNFDIENAFLVLRDTENFENLCFTEADDKIIKKNNEDKDDSNEDYQNLINSKGLEEVLRRKEFLFNIKIDRSQYQKKNEKENEDNKQEQGNDDKNETKGENQANKETDKDDGKQEEVGKEKTAKDDNEKKDKEDK